jgi:excinuclease UvrABC nuclease subunit
MAKAKNTIKAITRKTPGWITALQPLVLPAVPAVYVAFSGKRVTYIGSAVNLRSRFYLHGAEADYRKNSVLSPPREHWLNSPKFKLKYRQPRCYGEWVMAELRLISKLNPSFNSKGRRRAKETEPPPRRRK